MDVLSLIGLVLAFVAIVGGNFLEGGHVSALLNGPAALIVLGGSAGIGNVETFQVPDRSLDRFVGPRALQLWERSDAAGSGAGTQ